jgi:DNA (cytosine-5)-methyltransferase 1
MKSLSLFSGIGGIELALSQIGIEPIAFCDWEKYCQQILARRWPDVPVFGDVKELDIAQLEASGVPVDDIKIITGGYPCQSHSVAGKRKGRDDERHLWPEMFRLIQSISPDYIIGENDEGDEKGVSVASYVY